MYRSNILKIKEGCPELIESYGISYANKINPNVTKLKKILDRQSLEIKIAKNKELIKIVENVICNFYRRFLENDYIFILCDVDGYAIKILSDRYLHDYLKKINIIEGISFRTEDSGTNAINLAIANKKQIELEGKYHYCNLFNNWYCTAAPIIDYNNGEIIGYLDLSYIGNCNINDQSIILRNIVNCIETKLMYREVTCCVISKLNILEIEILRFLSIGKERKEICSEIAISERTLRRHLDKIYKILDVKNEVAAVAEAIRRGIID
jgi:transcriptional regulator of acetoin/glycerol metabolism